MQSRQYEAIKLKESSSDKIQDALVTEAALQININEEPYTVVMRTPNDDLSLIRGLLYAEDIYKNSILFNYNIIEEKENGFSIINLSIPNDLLGKGYMNKRTLLSVSSCGICGKQKIADITSSGEPLVPKKSINTSQLREMHTAMQENQNLFSTTGGSHAAAAFSFEQGLISIKEDIGRHNAFDKVIGDLLNKSQLKTVDCILVSGRVSYEIVSKAFIAQIPMIVAVSACSSLAVDFAKEFGICLIGFNRDDRATIYANPQYVDLK